MTVINLEQGMPTMENARIKLDQTLRSAKTRREIAVKVIHGYGSSGKGGAINRDVQGFLAGKRRARQIRGFVPGDRFSPFDADARAILDACPELGRDPDYSRCNHGITVVLL